MFFRPGVLPDGAHVNPRRIIQWVIGITFAAAGLWIFFRNVDANELVRQLAHSNPLVIISCAVLAVAAIWFRALRSSILLPSCTHAQRKELFPIIMIAFMINNILPARMGEAARAMLLWKKNGYSGAVSVGSIILERFIDTLAFLSCFFAPVFFISELSRGGVFGLSTKAITLQTLALIFSVIFFSSIVMVAVYSRYPKAVRRLGGRIVAMKVVSGRLQTRLKRIARELISNLDWTFSARRVAGVVVLSYAIVSCYAAMTVLLIHEKTFGFLSGLFAQAFAAFGAAIPLAPGYVGTLHAVFLQGLILCGIEREKAGAVTIFFHAVPYITVTALGVYYFFRSRLSIKEIKEAEGSIEKEETKGDIS
jgi:glycosyltransferase 2 family protein